MFTERPTCAVEKADTAGIGREIGTGGSNGICEGSPSCPPRACAKGGRPFSWALVGRAAAPTPCPAAPPGCSTTAPGRESSALVAEEGRRRNGLDSLTLAILAEAPPILFEEEQTRARSGCGIPHRDSARILQVKKSLAFHTGIMGFLDELVCCSCRFSLPPTAPACRSPHRCRANEPPGAPSHACVSRACLPSLMWLSAVLESLTGSARLQQIHRRWQTQGGRRGHI